MHALKGLACRKRVAAASSPAATYKQGAALTSPTRHGCGCARPSRARFGHRNSKTLSDGSKTLAHRSKRTCGCQVGGGTMTAGATGTTKIVTGIEIQTSGALRGKKPNRRCHRGHRVTGVTGSQGSQGSQRSQESQESQVSQGSQGSQGLRHRDADVWCTAG